MNSSKFIPDHRLAAVYLNKALLHQKPGWLFRARAATVALALLAVVVIALEILAIPHLFPSLLQPFRIAHNLLVAMSLASLSIAEAWHALRSMLRTKRFVRQAFSRKVTSFK